MTDAPDAAVTVEPWPDGASFLVKAHAGSRREGLGGVHDGMLRVDVSVAPEKGKANKAILKVLAKAIGVPPSQLVLLSGDTSPRKRFGVRGMDSATLAAILRRLVHVP